MLKEMKGVLKEQREALKGSIVSLTKKSRLIAVFL